MRIDQDQKLGLHSHLPERQEDRSAVLRHPDALHLDQEHDAAVWRVLVDDALAVEQLEPNWIFRAVAGDASARQSNGGSSSSGTSASNSFSSTKRNLPLKS